MVAGLISPDSGKVPRDGIDSTGMPMFQRAQHGTSYVPQEASVATPHSRLALLSITANRHED
jgi:ABC-type lipopolysaccharide export system ATPase subunit